MAACDFDGVVNARAFGMRTILTLMLQFNVCVVTCAVRVFGVGRSRTFTVSVSFHRSHVTCSFLNNGTDAESGNHHRKRTHGRAYKGVAIAVRNLV